MSSMCETVIAMVVLTARPIRVSVRLVASVEKYRRDPLSQENEPFDRHRPECDAGVAAGPQPVLVVVGNGVDRTDVRGAGLDRRVAVGRGEPL